MEFLPGEKIGERVIQNSLNLCLIFSFLTRMYFDTLKSWNFISKGYFRIELAHSVLEQFNRNESLPLKAGVSDDNWVLGTFFPFLNCFVSNALCWKAKQLRIREL